MPEEFFGHVVAGIRFGNTSQQFLETTKIAFEIAGTRQQKEVLHPTLHPHPFAAVLTYLAWSTQAVSNWSVSSSANKPFLSLEPQCNDGDRRSPFTVVPDCGLSNCVAVGDL